MNLQRLPEYLIRWIVTVCGILLALMLARSAGDGNLGVVAGVFLSLAVILIVLRFKEKIWVLIPIFWTLSGQIPSLGLPFAARDLVVLFVFIAFLTLKALKIVRRQTTFGSLEILASIMSIYVVISYIRNPVGVDALNSDRVGGRPYFNCFIAFLACWILRQTTLQPESANRLAFTMTAGRMIEGVLAQFLKWFPILGGFFMLYYSCGFFGWAQGDNTTPIPGAESTERQGYLVAIGQPLLIYLCCAKSLKSYLNNTTIYWMLVLLVAACCVYLSGPSSPLPFLLGLLFIIAELIYFYTKRHVSSFFWVSSFMVGISCVLLSGFRSALALSLGFFFLAEFVRYRWRGVISLAAVGAFILLIAVLGNGTFFSLPASAQRALSWLPGKWDTFAKLEASESTRWRTEMWKEMLTTDRYISNKVLGDGFGFSKRQYETILTLQFLGAEGGTAGQESFMITGSVHSGPVGAVRFGGYVGLLILLILLFAMMLEAWRLIKRSFHTPYRLLTMVICIPAVIEPFFFIFVFGAYENSIPDSLYTLGMLRMLANSLAAYEREPVPAMSQVSPERRRLVPTPSSACSITSSVFSKGADE
ncbi:MAG: hypothetical protein WCO71_00845 [Pseudomonadota bacterium]